MNILDLLEKSKTPYHAVEVASEILKANGFSELNEENAYNIEDNGRYYVRRNGSCLIAFTVNKNFNGFNIVASHTDSPCFKIKMGKGPCSANTTKLAVEQYGGGLRYTWFDRPLKICGRLCGEKDGKIICSLYESKNPVVIPSLAIHFNRKANDGFAPNVETDCPPLFSLGEDKDKFQRVLEESFDGKLLDEDLFLVSDEKPFICGNDGEFACSPRVDNLTSAFSSIFALIDGKTKNTCNIAYLADNEEVGSRTKQGAASDFLINTMRRINSALGYGEEHLATTLANSFIVSCDNAHATHPNHPELSDKTNNVVLGGGVVIKHHANQNYTTDGLSAAIFKQILEKSNIKYCDFYMRSDLPCGGTLGTISSSSVSIKSVDIGLGQLAMHSACELFALKDYDVMVNALTAFYSTSIMSEGVDKVNLK